MTEKHCIACHAGMPTLDESAILLRLDALPGWRYDKNTASLIRDCQFKGFYKAMAFANAVAWIAHEEKHHPDMTISYNRVVVHYQTHAVGGITENDFICAEKINALLALDAT